MEHWQVTYLGIRQIPRELTEFELATFFTFSAKERALIEARRGELYRLALALHIGFIRMSGRTLDAYKQVPKVLWSHLGAQLAVDPPDLGTLRTLYETRARTLIDHQVLAYQALGFRPMAEHQRRYVVRWLKERLTGRPERGDLLYELKRWLYEHHILIVHDRLLKRLIVKAGQDVEGSLTDGVIGAFGDATLDHWSRLLAQPDNDHGSLQQWLWAVPLRQSTHQMGDVFTKIDRLYAIGVHQSWPTLCNDAAVRHYARRCARRPPSVSKRVEQRSRRLEAACFMRYALCSGTDQLLSMLRHWVQKAVNDAMREVESIQLDPNARLREFAAAVKKVALDATLAREELSRSLCELADRAFDRRMPSRRSLVRARLLAKRGQARAILARLIRLPFEAQTTHPVINALDVLRDLYARKAYTLPDRVAIRLGRVWRDAIDGYDRHKALFAFEWATLFALRIALRNGSVFIEHSFAFRSQAMLLIPPNEWKAKRNNFYGHLELPQDPKEFLEPLIEHLDQGLIVLRDATTRGDVSIDSAVHLDPLSAQTPNPAVEALRRAIFSACPDGQLPEIILEVDSTTRFSWLLLGREPGSSTELLMVYAAVLAHGTSLTAADIARMVPELASAAIRQMMNRIADERKLRQAADAVLDFMHRHPIAAHLGRADLASSDMMSLETARTVWQARTDPRRRTASIGMYTHVRDRWGIFYDQPIVLNERQAGAAIEGVIRQSGADDVAQLAVDTHGYTDYAMGLARILGFDLCPRLSHLRDRRLHVPQHHTVPAELIAVTDRDVRIDLIESIWDEFVRVAASVQTGQCTAVQALARFGSAARGQPVYDGGVHIGRLFRTIYLIDYFTNPAFRAELQHVLNRGEAVHAVQRAIHIGKIPLELTRHHDSLAAVSSALALLSNAVMAWNTVHMQRAVNQIEAMSGEAVQTADLRRIAPTHLEGINLRGTFDFPIARYAHHLLPNAAGLNAKQRRLA